MILVVVTSCSSNTKELEMNNSSSNIDTSISDNESKQVSENNDLTKPNYIVLDDSILGTYENDKWNNIQDNDLNRNLIKEINSIKIEREILVQEINEQHFNLYSQDDLLAKTNKFNIPDFNHSPIMEYFIVGDEHINPLLAITASYNPLPTNPVVHASPSEKHISAVRNFLDKYKLVSTEVNITTIAISDLNNDGLNEEIIIAQTPKNEMGYPSLDTNDRLIQGKGVYLMALLMQENNTVPLYFEGYPLSDLKFDNSNELLPFGLESSMKIDLLGVFDLNGDDQAEISLSTTSWDISDIHVYELNQKFSVKEVLFGNFGW